MTPERLAQLRQIAEAATKGPWAWSLTEYEGDKLLAASNEVLSTWGGEGRASGIEIFDEDAEFIATFNPATAREVLDEIERLQARLDAVEELHQEHDWSYLDGMYSGSTVCNHCRRDWPCDTIKAVRGE